MSENLTAVTNPPAAERSAARTSLARISEQLAAASAALREANRPVERLSAVCIREDGLRQRLASLAESYGKAVARWIATGCEGDRPQPDPEQLAVEVELGQVAADAEAARQALPQFQAVAQQAAEAIPPLGREREAIMHAVTIEAVAAYCAGPYQAAVLAFLEAERPVRGLADELRTRGVAPLGLNTAVEIERVIRETRAAVTLAGDLGPGRRFLLALPNNPDAVLA